MFGKTRVGMRVIISPNDENPVEVSHPALFSPNAEDVAAAPGRVDVLAREAKEAAKAFKEADKAAKSRVRKVELKKKELLKLEQRKKRAYANLKRAIKALPSAEQAKVRARRAAAKGHRRGRKPGGTVQYRQIRSG